MTKHRVLVPNDGSRFSRRIFPQIMKFLPPDENELVLLRVGDHPEGLVGAPPRPAAMDVSLTMYATSEDAQRAAHPIYASQERDSAEAEIKRNLLEDAHALKDAGYDVSVEVRFGDKGEEIIRYVENHPVDMIAMTTHWRRGLQKLFHGSVAQEVAGHVTVPVFMMRPENEEN